MDEDGSTRDLAVKADTKIDAHIDVCATRWAENTIVLRAVQADLKKIFYILGGITAAGHLIEILMQHLK